MAFNTWAVPRPWDLCAETLHSQTLSSLLKAGGRNFSLEDILQNVWGAENGRQTWR